MSLGISLAMELQNMAHKRPVYMRHNSSSWHNLTALSRTVSNKSGVASRTFLRLCIHRLGNSKWKKAWRPLINVCKKRHTIRIHESMNDVDLLSHNDAREATPLLLLAVHPHTWTPQFPHFCVKTLMEWNMFFRPSKVIQHRQKKERRKETR